MGVVVDCLHQMTLGQSDWLP